MRLVAEFDDLHWKAPYTSERQDVLAHARALIAMGVKVSFFAPANFDGRWIGEVAAFRAEVEEMVAAGNVRVAMHGLAHTPHEFEGATIDENVARLRVAEQSMREAGIPFVRVFRAPFWQLDANALEALALVRYSRVYQHPARVLPARIKTVTHNWNCAPNTLPPVDAGTWILHGHTHDRASNGIRHAAPLLAPFVGQFESIFVDEV